LLAVHQRRLEDGATGCLHRLEPNRSPGEPAVGRQSEPLSDSAGCCDILLDLTNYLETLSAVHLLSEFVDL
jgi:hypothetical protein